MKGYRKVSPMSEHTGVGRPELTETVRIGPGDVKVPTKEINHISGEVEIELSGARQDLDDVVGVTKAIEQAVIEAVDEYNND